MSMLDREEFRLDRVTRMGEVSDAIYQHVDDANAETIGGEEMALALEPHLEEAFYRLYVGTGEFALFDTPQAAWRWTWQRIRPGITAASDLANPRRIADWLGTALVNAATVTSTDSDVNKMWLSRRDDRVRPFHVEADGQTVPWDEPFTVCDGRRLDFPGQPVGEPSCWINCRCVVRPMVLTASAEFGQHDVIFLENRRTPKVVPKGKRYQPKPSEGRITKRRAATADEEKVIARGDWVRVNEKGKKPGQPGYMDKKSKVRPQHNSAEDVDGYSDAEEVTDMSDVLVDDDLDMSALADEVDEGVATPWFGVLAPEGVYSGDGRKFTDNALSWRDLPMPLLWQEKSGNGHAGSVIVGRITDVYREGNLVWAAGDFAQTEEADKVIGLLSEGHLRGVSVDVDQAEMAMEDDDSENILFSKGRISAATLVPIPAFAEAFVSLGIRAVEAEAEPVAAAVQSPTGPVTGAEDVELPFAAEFISEEPWDGSAGRFTPEQWKKSCILHVCDGPEKSCHKLPIREPGGALSRAGVHAAAARINQVDASPEQISAAKGHLRGAYKQLGEEAPDVLKASAYADMLCGCRGCDEFDCGENGCTCCWSYDADDNPVFNPEHPRDEAVAASAQEFKRGPGWVTNPADTKRIHDYWTKPGHEGYAKIGWGTPGDYRRLRAHLAKYIGPRFLNRTTAQWHHDALGYWPGECGRPGNPPCGKKRLAGETIAAAVELVASGAGLPPLDAEWFADPKFDAATPITVTDDGRVYGHLATWGTCHIGIPGQCVTAPPSPSGYAYYRTGTVTTNTGPVPVGQITMDTGHASLSAGAKAAASHYDNTGTVVADVAAGDDEFGVWVAGALRDNVPAEKVTALRAGALSGDWRAIGGNLELVAALVVNVPGFPVPRVGLAASGTEQTALVAAGCLAPARVDRADVDAAVDDLVDEVAARLEQRAARRARAAALLDDTRALRVAALMADVEV